MNTLVNSPKTSSMNSLLWYLNRLFCLVTVTAGISTANLQAKSPPAPSTYTVEMRTTVTASPSPATFPCSGRIYAHIGLPPFVTGQHLLEALWRQPDGETRERTNLDMDLRSPGPHQARLWLELKPKTDSIFDEFSFGGDYGASSNV